MYRHDLSTGIGALPDNAPLAKGETGPPMSLSLGREGLKIPQMTFIIKNTLCVSLLRWLECILTQNIRAGSLARGFFIFVVAKPRSSSFYLGPIMLLIRFLLTVLSTLVISCYAVPTALKPRGNIPFLSILCLTLY